jgi:kumamolisin
MPQSRITLAGSKRGPIPNSQPVAGVRSRPNPNENIEVTISLRRKASIPAWVTHSGVLSREQLAADYGATASDFIAIQRFAKKFNLVVVEESSLTATVKVSGSVRDLENAFGTKLKHVHVANAIYRERTGHIALPKELAFVVEGVFGLDNRRQANPRFRPSIGPRVAHSFSPVDIARLYNFPGGDGSGHTIGIIELGGGFKQSDLNTYFAGLGLPVPNVTAVSVDGGKNLPAPNDPHDPDAEVMLDIEVAGAVAPKANIKVYFAPNTDKGFLDAINAAIKDMVTVISISWGGPESTWTKASMNAFEKSFQTAAGLSIPVTVASGDDGSTDGTNVLAVDFPASAPHALACGGTHLEGGVTITNEVVWNSNGGGTGGGFSTVFPKPAYQNGISYSPVPSNAGRGVPDICGDAAPETGYKIRRDGQNIVIGGTSAVAPLWAGLIARLAQKTGDRIPFLNPILYANPNALRDITTGDNDVGNGGGKYKAAKGWDPCTGLGSPKGAALLTALQGGTPTPTSTHTPTATSTPKPPTTHTQKPPVTSTQKPTASQTQKPITTHTQKPPVTSTQKPPTPPPTHGSGSMGRMPSFNQRYQVPRPAPSTPASAAPVAAPTPSIPSILSSMGVTTNEGGQAGIQALVAIVATVATTAITAITSITAIAANSKNDS